VAVNGIKNSERGGKAKLVFLEHDTKNADSEAFWKALGGESGVKTEAEGGSDDEVKAAAPITLFRYVCPLPPPAHGFGLPFAYLLRSSVCGLL
jgi:hypothetical protein